MDEILLQVTKLADELHHLNGGDSSAFVTLNWILAVLIGILVAIICHLALDFYKLVIYLSRKETEE